MARASLVICGVAVASLLAGCTNLPSVSTDVVTPGMPNPELALQNSMATVRTAMYQLDGMRVAPIVAQPPIVPNELNRPVSFVWQGSLEQGVRLLAARVGYRVYFSAPPNSRPLAVSVNVSNVTALDAFQAIGRAAGSSATVVVNPQHQLVEVFQHV